MQEQQLTVEHVRQERGRLQAAIATLDRKHSAAANLADVLGAETATLAQVKEAFAAYYAAETLALDHDLASLRQQMLHLGELEEQVRMASSGLVVGRWSGERR